jgi:putative hydrolase of the HAD superfamily
VTAARHDLQAVVFDWGGTLTPWHNIVPLDGWLEVVGDAELAARLLAAEESLWARSRDEHRSGTLDEVFALAGLAPTPELLAAFHRWWEPHTFLDPEVPELFTELRRRGLRIGVLSNTLWPRREHERIFERDGVADLIDGAVYTSDLAWTKPHPEAFHAALRAVGVTDPARAVFVGDRRFDDIFGARSVGMRAVLVPHSDIPTRQIGHTEGEPDAVVSRLSDLLPILDRWTEPT